MPPVYLSTVYHIWSRRTLKMFKGKCNPNEWQPFDFIMYMPPFILWHDLWKQKHSRNQNIQHVKILTDLFPYDGLDCHCLVSVVSTIKYFHEQMKISQVIFYDLVARCKLNFCLDRCIVIPFKDRSLPLGPKRTWVPFFRPGNS